mmetsp:Transcript_44743/g.103500  ORF Transcript_44743/g.103500 Transcript_44743/m.103500 type:complete len:765 (+) Transcript_44743:167-2461(+)
MQVAVVGIEDFPLKRGRCGTCCDNFPTVLQVERILEGYHKEEDFSLGTVETEQDDDGSAIFSDPACPIPFDDDGDLRFMVHRGQDQEVPVAQTVIKVRDLARQRIWRLLLVEFDPRVDWDFNLRNCDEALYGTDGAATTAGLDPDVRRPAFLLVQVFVNPEMGIKQKMTPDFVPHVRRAKSPNKKRILMFTRGTRGDIQPFVALARGLCKPPFNCEVILATELENKDSIKSARFDLPEGSLLFRPLGGNTMAYTKRKLLAGVMSFGQHADFLQSIYFSMQEVTYFQSEGTAFFWAYQENPDFIVFSMTFVNVAMIISESLGIPIVGFILQPARAIEARHQLFDAYDELVQPARALVNDEEFNIFLTHAAEKSGFTGMTLNEMRQSRGLHPTPPALEGVDTHYLACQRQGVTMVCPIPDMVATKNPAHLEMTNFIFLSTENEVVSPEVEAFIANAHAEHRRVGVIAFSSMPVGMRKLLNLAFNIVKHCRAQSREPAECVSPALLLMAAGQDEDGVTDQDEATRERLQEANRLLVERRAQPFHALFNKLDFAILHGGLGVTSEALFAGIPVVTSGIQLLDQRWWGARMLELGVGSAGVPIDRLLTLGHGEDGAHLRVVELVNQAIDLRLLNDLGEPTWVVRAKEVKQGIHARMKGDMDGVKANAKAVYEAGVLHPCILKDVYIEYDVPLRRCWGFVMQCGCIASFCETILSCLLCVGLPGLFVFFMRLFEHCFSCGPCRYRVKTKELMEQSHEFSDDDIEAHLLSE